MSREIKFRAWDKFEKVWMEAPVIDGENGKALGFSLLDGAFQRHFSDEEVAIVQFTGLLDKNGVEIYEGDILIGGKLHLTGGVELSNEDVATTVTYRDGMFKLGGVSLISFNKRAKVIGNIYENPELLEVTP